MTEESWDLEDTIQLLKEVLLEIGPEDSLLPDAAFVAEKRAEPAKEVAEIKARGQVPDIPQLL